MIGKSLEADIHFHVKDGVFELLKRHEAGLKEFFNVSEVLVLNASEEPEYRVPAQTGQQIKTTTTSSNLSFAVRPAAGHKCARCWNFMPEVSNYGIWQNVCTRCQDALKEMKIEPPIRHIDWVPHLAAFLFLRLGWDTSNPNHPIPKEAHEIRRTPPPPLAAAHLSGDHLS